MVIRRRFFPSKIIPKSNFGDCFKNADFTFRDCFGEKNYFKAKLHKTELNIGVILELENTDFS